MSSMEYMLVAVALTLAIMLIAFLIFFFTYQLYIAIGIPALIFPVVITSIWYTIYQKIKP